MNDGTYHLFKLNIDFYILNERANAFVRVFDLNKKEHNNQ